MPVSRKEDALRRILEVKVLPSDAHLPSTPSNTVSATPGSITFPPLPDVLSELRTIGIAERAASRMHDIFRVKCAQLQSLYCNKLPKLQSHSSPSVHHLLHISIQKMYLENVSQFRSEVIKTAKLHCDKMRASVDLPLTRPSRLTFNHDYVPVLETYFEYNAYPSAADRTLMARKSMMTERQIEVWFQNHRNRARKEGKPLLRMHRNDPLPADLSLDTLDERLGDLIRPESECHTEIHSDDSDSEICGMFEVNKIQPIPAIHSPMELATNPLTSLPPPCISRPSVSFLNAIAQKSSFQASFPTPVWRRPSSVAPRATQTPLTTAEVDSLIALFSRLSVREASQKGNRHKMAPLMKNKRFASPTPHLEHYANAATQAITTVLCNRRHPALVTTTIEPRYTTMLNLRSTPMAGPPTLRTAKSKQRGISSCIPDRSPAPSTSNVRTPTTSSPLLATPHRLKKAPQLPKRVPGSHPLSHHPSLYHPYATLSRTSPSSLSLSSESSPTNSSTRSSSSSESSSTPTTPELGSMSPPTIPSTLVDIDGPLSTIPPIASNSLPPWILYHADQTTYTKASVSTSFSDADLATISRNLPFPRLNLNMGFGVSA